jgi:hypothetical protein
MKNLLIVILLLVSSVIFSQTDYSDRIDYTKFDKSLFDSLMLDEINMRRIEIGLSPFIFDSICHKSAHYQSEVMCNKGVEVQINYDTLDGVVLKIAQDRFDYFNMTCQISSYNQKKLENEGVVSVRIGKNSKTFTYIKLIRFLLDNFLDEEFQNNLMRGYDSIEIFSAFSVEIKLTEEEFYVFVTNIISSK